MIISLKNSVFAVVIALALSACSNAQVSSFTHTINSLPGHINGHSITLYNAGVVYAKHKDYQKALGYFLKSAKLGYDRAMVAAGLMYATGDGALMDKTDAAFWIKKAYQTASANYDDDVRDMALAAWKRYRLWKWQSES